MADEASNDPRPFDVSTIEFLVALMSKHDISEIDLREGPQRIHLRRGAIMATTILPGPMPQQPPAPGHAGQAPAEKAPSRNLIEIKSPAIGTFYDREKPESPPYVTVGSRVSPNTVVGLLETMKLFSEINAGCNGVIVEVVAERGEAVEYNQVLFRVDPSK